MEAPSASDVVETWTVCLQGAPHKQAPPVRGSVPFIPMVNCHASTGKWEVMPACVDYWVRPDILTVLKRHESYLLINIANEAGEGIVTSQMFWTAYELAVRRIRAAGLHVAPIIG